LAPHKEKQRRGGARTGRGSPPKVGGAWELEPPEIYPPAGGKKMLKKLRALGGSAEALREDRQGAQGTSVAGGSVQVQGKSWMEKGETKDRGPEGSNQIGILRLVQRGGESC